MYILTMYGDRPSIRFFDPPPINFVHDLDFKYFQ